MKNLSKSDSIAVNKVTLLAICCLILLFIQCDPVDNRLVLINNSDENIYFTYSGNDDSLKYADYISWGEYNLVKKKEKRNIGMNGSWPNSINGYPGKKISFFIISEEIFNNNTWEELINKNLYSKNYILSVDDLESVNWEINYP